MTQGLSSGIRTKGVSYADAAGTKRVAQTGISRTGTSRLLCQLPPLARSSFASRRLASRLQLPRTPTTSGAEGDPMIASETSVRAETAEQVLGQIRMAAI